MGRAREFEDNEALEKAMLLFWEKGYDNTSLKDLLSEMNILNGSFYNRFGNKKNLLLKTLEYYREEVTAKRGKALEESPLFRDGIRALFDEIFQCLECQTMPRGCMLANSLSNEVMADPEVKAVILEEVKKFEVFFEYHIHKAIESQELDLSIDSKLMARVLVVYIQGCMKLSTVDFEITRFKAQTEYFLSSIGL